LPTEEEWERAVRGRDGSEYPWGEVFQVWRANTGENDAERIWGISTTAVCTYPQGTNAEGVWDAAGNVWAWTASWYEVDRVDRVLRGGSWKLDRWGARCAYRVGILPDDCHFDVGFRVVVSLASSAF
jgi:formylglycine-generating enzyme required for sulfatase activity